MYGDAAGAKMARAVWLGSRISFAFVSVLFFFSFNLSLHPGNGLGTLPQMIVRLSDSLSREWIVVAAFVVASWLSFFGLRTTIARRRAEGETAKQLALAVRREPRNPSYWCFLGHFQQYNLEQPDSDPHRLSRGSSVQIPTATRFWIKFYRLCRVFT